MLKTAQYIAIVAGSLLLSLFTTHSAQASEVDLSVSQIQVPSEIVLGQSFPLSAVIHCSGDQPATFHYAVYLTINGAIQGAVSLGTFGPITLSPNSSLNIHETISPPQTVSGRQRIAVVVDVDNQVSERNEYDNIGLASNYMRIRSPLADLRVASVQINATQTQAGASLIASYRVENIGLASAAFNVAALISHNSAVTTGDIEIARERIELAPGQSLSQALQLTLPARLRAGDYHFAIIADPESQVSEVQESNNIGVASQVLNIFSPQLEIQTLNLPRGTVFIEYYAQIAALGGDGHFHFAVSEGRLPRGLALNSSTGIISGKPSESGSQALSITVSSDLLSTSKDFVLQVSPSGIDLVITTPTLGIGTIGLPYQAELTAAGGEPPYTWRLAEGALPQGIDLNSSGWLSGIPQVEGHYTLSLEVVDGLGARDLVEFVFVIQSANVTITTIHLSPATLGEAVDTTLQVSGGRAPYVWEAKSRLPLGLTLTEEGQLLGIPSQVGVHAFRLKVTDGSEAGASDTGLFHLEVMEQGVFRIVAPRPPQVLTREKLEYVVRAEGGSGALEWRLEPGDHLPEGFEFIPSERAPDREMVLRGSSLYGLTHGFGIQVKDRAGRVRKAALVVQVNKPAVGPVNEGCRCLSSADSSGKDLAGVLIFSVLGVLLHRRRRLND